MRTSRLIPALLISLGAYAAPRAIRKDLHVHIPMRDGVELCANVFRPATPARAPALLVRTPYGKGADITPNFQAFVERGYAVIVQDVRGRFHSGGEFDLFGQEAPDGSDTIDWIARQPWSNGRVGMFGGSYLGIVQWRAALTGNPHLKAIFPSVSGADEYFDRFYSRGGALKLGHRLLWLAENFRAPGTPRPDFQSYIWHLPLRTSDRAATGLSSVSFFQDALDHPVYDAFWRSASTLRHMGRIRVPVFSAGGWYDNFVESDLEAFAQLRDRGHTARAIIGPWPHNLSAEFQGVDFGPAAKVALRTLQLEWFDYWLKSPNPAPGGPSPARPPLRIFVMGANRWRDERDWPLPRAKETAFYLSSRGKANSLAGDGALSLRIPQESEPDRFVYDPRKPVPTLGGPVCCNPKIFPWGPMDQRPVENRQDVLVYTTSPLRQPLEVTGPVRLVLYASTSAPDTDFTAKLVDVFPDGHARNLTDGILRLRYRNSVERPVAARAGEIHALTINAGVTSNLFRKGHRIRLEVSSSNFPRFDRNPNTGGAAASETRLVTATQTVYHDRHRPSRLLLPVVPRSGR